MWKKKKGVRGWGDEDWETEMGQWKEVKELWKREKIRDVGGGGGGGTGWGKKMRNK